MALAEDILLEIQRGEEFVAKLQLSSNYEASVALICAGCLKRIKKKCEEAMDGESSTQNT